MEKALTCPRTAISTVTKHSPVKDLALAGAGIALLPKNLVDNDLHNSKLIERLPEWDVEKLGIYAIYLSKTHSPQILRLLLDFLIQRFSEWEARLKMIKPFESCHNACFTPH